MVVTAIPDLSGLKALKPRVVIRSGSLLTRELFVARIAYTGRLKLARSIFVQLTVLAMLAPVLSLTLACTAPQAGSMASMACCRTLHSTCMQGERAGSLACCHRVQPQAPAALTVAANEAVAPVAAACADSFAVLTPATRLAASRPAQFPPGPLLALPLNLRI